MSDPSGHAIALSPSYPDRGQLLPDFVLASSQGEPTQISDYRGRSNLVMISVGEPDDSPLAEIARRHAEFPEEEAKIAAIFQCPWKQAQLIKQRQQLPFLVLADEDGRVCRSIGTLTPAGKLAPAVYITDRFGEVFAAYRTAEGQPHPRPERCGSGRNRTGKQFMSNSNSIAI